MKKITLIFLLILHTLFCFGQKEQMNNEKLGTIIEQMSEAIEGEAGAWQFVIDSVLFICITDEKHNRMRIMAPVIEEVKMTDEQLKKCMEANFHTVLDSKYALSDEILWSVFIHPLKELSEAQVLDAISQVYSGARTFGTYYSSGSLSFPGAADSKGKKKLKKS